MLGCWLCLLGRVERPLSTTRTRRASLGCLEITNIKQIISIVNFVGPLRTGPRLLFAYLRLRWGRRWPLSALGAEVNATHLVGQPIHSE